MVNIGRMNHRVVLQSKTSTQDATGSAVETWKTKGTLWAEVVPLNSREYWAAQQVQSDVTHRVSIRYYDGLRPDWRMKFGTRLFDIRSVINVDEGNEWHVLLCKEELT